MVDKHESAWRIPSRTYPDEYGVLVKCGSDERPHWYLLCPADATLYMGPEFDLRDCHMGPSCDHDDVHEDAHKLCQSLTRDRRAMNVGDRLYGYPCEVNVREITADGRTAWGLCRNPDCRQMLHPLDVPLYESGRGPWRTEPWPEYPARIR